ncbi:MAG: hypothetical protein H6644_04380 [Caldilineaceae bacterium]|nr:hypothetical protein [Caldilineaceae bacterium]
MHSGDVKVYAYEDVQPRASLAYAWTPVDSVDAPPRISPRIRRARNRPVIETEGRDPRRAACR